ncbi:MAG TPA: site-specific integrase [Candidatus Udaeobacter sp.]|jgi:integrase
MASIHRQPGRPYWFCAFSIFNPETHTSKRVFRSTKTTDRKQALEICRAWHKAALQARNGKLSVDAAREVIARGVSDVFTAANVESLPSASIKSWCETWLQAKAIEAGESTHDRYKCVVERFTSFLGEAKSKRDISTLQASDIARFRDREAKERSRATANLSVKVLRVCLGEAVRQGLLPVSPALRVPILKLRDKSARRAFTLSEIKRILKASSDDAEWRGLVLFGLYLGQRLGDLAKLTWRAVNLETGEIAFTARKTGRRIVLPLVQPLSDYLSSLPASDNPNASIFPRAASAKRTGSLSNQFREILADAGLVEPRGHEATKKGRSQARETSEISFHSLRHSAVTMLKASGLSDVFAREIVGHESAAISRQYTHLSTDDLRAAMKRLPDVTNA